eukprot:11900530-Alexandrium_andersonii.AAC.1
MTPNAPDEASEGGNLRSFLGSRSSSSERLKQFYMFWDLYIARCPTCTPKSAQGPSMPQPASIRLNPQSA